MAEATWGDANTPSDIDWRMSASLQNVPRGGEDVAEVTSLKVAVQAWLELDREHQEVALLTPEQPIRLNEGASLEHFSGEGIRALANHLPTAG